MMMTVPVKVLDTFDEWKNDQKVCVFCDREVSPLYDSDYYFCCDTYKGIMTIAEWEAYTGEVWEE
jgi:hypothetical protein